MSDSDTHHDVQQLGLHVWDVLHEDANDVIEGHGVVEVHNGGAIAMMLHEGALNLVTPYMPKAEVTCHECHKVHEMHSRLILVLLRAFHGDRASKQLQAESQAPLFMS
jgi:hypothetical protein